MSKRVMTLALCLLAISAHAQTSLTYTQLREGFANPPQAAKLRCYWWWLNGNTDETTITHDLEEMKAKGFGGALLVDANGSNQTGNRNVPAGPTFASPAWTKLYVHALREADRLGLKISLNITSGWNLGGPEVKPEEASKLLTWSRTVVTGPKTVHIELPQPPTKNAFYRQIAILAYPLHHGTALQAQPDDRQGDHHTASQRRGSDPLRFRSAAAETGFSMPDSAAMLDAGTDPHNPASADAALAEVQDITSHLSGNTLDWTAPAGEWEVLRIGYTDSDARISTASGAWQGLAIDYLDHHAFDTYWTRTVEPLLQAAKPYVGRSLKYLVSDSWELGGTNWTGDFRQQFQQRRGYDPLLWLPVVAGRILGDRDQSTRFLTDLRRTVADLIVTEHYDVFAQHAKQYGLGTHPESGGPHGAPIDALETFRSSALAQTEYWAPNAHRPTDEQRFFTKEGASAMNIYGLAYNAQEGMTSIGPQWSESLATDLKPAFDQAITEGMTRLIWHEWTSSPASTGLPGQEYFAGTHLNPKVTWWNAASDFFLYLNRVQFLAQQGTPVNDALYFYGDHVPNFVRLKADDPAHVLPGYDYDVTNEDALLSQIRVENGTLRGPKGISWRALILPRTRKLSTAALAKVKTILKEGGTVVGMPPLSPTGNVSSALSSAFDRTVQEIWQGCAEGQQRSYGHGTLLCTQNGSAALRTLQVPPDFDAHGANLDYMHRRSAAADVYFVRNGSDTAITTPISFRVHATDAEWWDAVSGSVRALPVSSRTEHTADVALNLPAFGSGFVVFAAAHTAKPAMSADADPARTVALGTSWSILFQSDRGAPQTPQVVSKLQEWSRSDVPGIRYFAGTAKYTNHFRLEGAPPRELLLQLTSVHQIARVRLNGADCGTIWAKPYELRIRSGWKPGENTLEIEVTNNWPNRIIGDLQTGAETTYTQTNITAYTANSPLQPSGLIGPVTLQAIGK